VNISKKTGIMLAGAGLIAGSVVTLGLQSKAQTTGSTPTRNTAFTAQAQFDPSKGGHMANGLTEALLTGDTADKVKTAALAAVPGGTIQRVETDAEGAVYEAHMLKSDGTPVTVKFDANYSVTAQETGFGGGHRTQTRVQ
jgi:hypothetical protein